MAAIENYEWNDVILYAKGWYERSGNVFADIAECIKRNANRYIIIPKTEERLKEFAVYWLLFVLDDLHSKFNVDEHSEGFWLYGYHNFYSKVLNRQSFFELTHEEAVCWCVLEVFMMLDSKKVKLNRPVYKRGERRIGSLSGNHPISMTYKHMNDIAKRIFEPKQQENG